jgi:lactoylglutathione lyase
VESMADTLTALAAKGIAAEPPSSPDGSADFLVAWLTDPDGRRIELVQWPPGHPAGLSKADLTQ